MNRIVSIKLNDKESKYWIELDDGRKVGVSPAIFLASGYHLDDLISQDEWRTIARDEERAKLRKRALALLDYGDRTELELRKRLQGDAELIDELIDDLRQAHLVDDQRYTELAIERHMRRGGWGKRKLTYQLQRSGVGDELLHAVEETIDEKSELAAAFAWARRKLRHEAQDDPWVLRRLYNALLRRGFEHSVAQTVIRNLQRDGMKDEKPDEEITLLT